MLSSKDVAQRLGIGDRLARGLMASGEIESIPVRRGRGVWRCEEFALASYKLRKRDEQLRARGVIVMRRAA